MNNGPAMHMGTTTTTITETHVTTNIRWDPGYITGVPENPNEEAKSLIFKIGPINVTEGVLKLAAIKINLIVFICVMCSGSYYREQITAEWTDFVAMTGFWVTGILLIFYLIHVIEKFHVIPWLMIEMGFNILWAFFYMTCSIDLAVQASSNGLSSYIAASFFGFVAMGIYGFDGFLKFKGWKAGEIAQGKRVVAQAKTETY